MYQLDPDATQVPVMEGWSIELGDGTFEITDAQGGFVLSGDLDESMRAWPRHAIAAGKVHAIFGFTADVHDYISNPTGKFAQGVITTIVDHSTPPADTSTPDTDSPASKSGFWSRLFWRR